MKSLTWIHLSDLHFGHGKDAMPRFDQKLVTKAILRDVEVVAGELGPPDIVFLTGDIAFSASAEKEYPAASDWLDKLLSTLKIGRDRVLLVPGNHDVDRKKALEGLSRLAHKGLRADPAEVNGLLEKADDMVAIWPKLAAYQKFASAYGSPEITPAQPFWTKPLPSDLGLVHVIGLNTTLLSFDGKDSPSNLALGLGQLHRALDDLPRSTLLFVLLHHPPHWLRDGEHLRAMLKEWPHILLCGHVHEQHGFVTLPFASRGSVELVAGAGHKDASEDGEHAYAWGRLDYNGFAFYPRAWFQKEAKFAQQRIVPPDDQKEYTKKLGEFARISQSKLPEALATWLKKSAAYSLATPVPDSMAGGTTFRGSTSDHVPALKSDSKRSVADFKSLLAKLLGGKSPLMGRRAERLHSIVTPELLQKWIDVAKSLPDDDGAVKRRVIEMWREAASLQMVPPVAVPIRELDKGRSTFKRLYIEKKMLWISAPREEPRNVSPRVCAAGGEFRWKEEAWSRSHPLAGPLFELVWDVLYERNIKDMRPDTFGVRWWNAAGGHLDTAPSVMFAWPLVDLPTFWQYEYLVTAWNRAYSEAMKLCARFPNEDIGADDLASWYVGYHHSLWHPEHAPVWNTEVSAEKWTADIAHLVDKSSSTSWHDLPYVEWVRALPLLAAPESGLSSEAASAILAGSKLDASKCEDLHALRRIRARACISMQDPEATLEEIDSVYPDHPWVEQIEKERRASAALFATITALPTVEPSIDERWTRLTILAEEVRSCTRCELHKQRSQTVFARGNPFAELCFVGEAPSADEDRIGEPFAGAAGQLLDQMIAAMGYHRDEVYVCNFVKCRPPNNRKPEPSEMASCEPHLAQQLALIQPKVIVALGSTAMQGLTGATHGIARLRGTWKIYKGSIPVMPTYHPAYLLRNPGVKHDVWNDLREVLGRLGRSPAARSITGG